MSTLETTSRKESQPEFFPNSNPSQVNLEHIFPQNAKEADGETASRKAGQTGRFQLGLPHWQRGAPADWSETPRSGTSRSPKRSRSSRRRASS
ncbi:hypothetical protein J5Y05_13210 [Streptomyces sp. RG38]|uniref:Uncharacterized protein n=1 Tax=Streptomyces tagetis TaxID=2820809 RepID=A0A940XFD7_9ACTN|nr:hypothetical protein [Streptomyces sp. RG38]